MKNTVLRHSKLKKALTKGLLLLFLFDSIAAAPQHKK